jgi:aminoglycoside phosphotransferase (APT) family kinase protein
VRLPRVQGTSEQVDKEQWWLPKLAPLLPLSIPVPLAKGLPGEGYPCHWSVYQWFEGEMAAIERIADPLQAATKLGQFVAALQQIDPIGGPPPGAHNSFRGAPLATRDAETRNAIASLRGVLDADIVTSAWDAALRAPVWLGAPVWLHGELIAGNLLAHKGQLRAVIDFGCLGVGDPACDVMAAWTYLPATTRDRFRAALPVDDATWERGRGWALSFGLIALPYYHNTNPGLAGTARAAIDAALTDQPSVER